jgi:exonuclease 1
MLSGCDYLASINGLGIKTANKLLRKYRTVEKVLQYIQLETSFKIPRGYLTSFRTAELAFLHQRVFDPNLKKVVPLNPIGNEKEWTEEMKGYIGR